MVDDDPAILDIGKILLEQSKDIIVDTFKSPIEAMEKLKIESFDAIISDYEMPWMDGITFLKRIRAIDNDIPFILLTGKGREDVVIEAINNGANSYLRKKGSPEVQFAKLAHRVQQNVAQKRAVEEIRKRDRLQAAVATAARELLTSTDLEDTVSRASKCLGLAASADIVFIFKNHDDPETDKHLMSCKFGWSCKESLITEKRSFLQNMSYEELCPSCYKHLSSGKTIRWTSGGFPETAQEVFQKIPHLLSILIVPIITEDHFWGFIGFGDCHSERIWSNSEVSVISTAAESIGGAIMRNRIEGELRKYQEDLEALVNERTAELEAKNSEMERFAYAISHDLMTPLVTIGGFVGFLRKDIMKGDHELIEVDLKTIEDVVAKMETQLTDTLELSRIGKVAGSPEDVPFAEIAQEALSQISEKITSGGIEVSVADDLSVVHVDRQRIVEVLVNLIENSIKCMVDEAHPKIKVDQRIDEEKTVFFVRDNGKGIDPSQHEKVFDLFYKLDTDSQGTGAGLAIVKKIIEVHDGRIWIESEEGQGCTVCFTLPICS